MTESSAAGRVLLVGMSGNPNAGKSSLFNAATGARQHVANYPGVTVEKKEGYAVAAGRRFRIIDLPGTYSLNPCSLDEVIVRDFLTGERPDVVVDVVDASNLERNLYLTCQLVELGLQITVALNMIDVARARGIKIDVEKLSVLLGAPVIPTVGRTGEGVRALLAAVARVAEGSDPAVRHIHVDYGREVEEEIAKLREVLFGSTGLRRDDPYEEHHARWLAVRLLERDARSKELLERWGGDAEAIEAAVDRSREHLEKIHGRDVETIVADRIYSFVNGLVREVCEVPRVRPETPTDAIDGIVTHRWLGLPIFFVLMWFVFKATFVLAEHPMAWIESAFSAAGDLARRTIPAGMLQDLLVDGVISGVGGIIVFLPTILILFFFLALLEDSGYMARAAFIMDRVMHAFGLHGKSFVALLTGFGCNAPAVMAARTLESREERIITILIIPLMSCSARYPVYVLIAGAFFPSHQAEMVLLVYLLGIGLSVVVAKLFRRFIFRGESTPFVLELPPYRMPTARALIVHMWERGTVFVKKAGTVILAGTVLVWALTSFPRAVDVSRDFEGARSAVERARDADLARSDLEWADARAELEAVYSHPLIPFVESHEYRESLRYHEAQRTEIVRRSERELRALRGEEARERARARLAGRFGRLIEPAIAPLGFDWRIGVSLIPGFAAKEIVVSSLGVLFGHGEDEPEAHGLRGALAQAYTPLVGLAFMIFTLLYTPCLATVAVIAREIGWRWALFSVAYSVILAYTFALVIYQGGRLLGLG
ncbi:MAG: ferrous iron transport protein B [Planctomycetes bacterium]|nr:ferrous iron transport protein B [Planctomycetota bacterium]